MNIKSYLETEYVKNRKSQNQIAIEQDLPLDVIEYLIKRCNLNYSRSKIKFTVNESKFQESDPIFMYYVGLIATDGYIDVKNNRVSLRLKNNDSYRVLTLLMNYFEYSGRLFKYGDNYEFRITSVKLIQILNELNIPSIDKTFNLKVPNSFHSESTLRMYLRGVHDGDGNVHRAMSKYKKHYTGGSWRLLTGSFGFIEGICKLINTKFKFNLKLSINSRKNNKEYPQIATKKTEGIELLKWIYTDFEDYKLLDKYEKYLSVLR
jgi:hypothetical protein